MATDKMLFHIDEFVVNGDPQAFEDGTATITGAGRWENTAVPSASGDDFQSRKRVATQVKFKLQFGPGENPAEFASMIDVQIACRDKVSGRRALLPRCGFANMGEIGSGSVEVTFNVLAPIQWL